MLALRGLTYRLGDRTLLDEADAAIPRGARIGLVGRNGAGKTTLFRLIRGELTPDGGAIETPKTWRLGGVDQEAPAGPEPLIDIVLAADRERAALLAEAETAEDPMRLAEIQTRLTDIGAHSAEARAAAILAGLGFDHAAQARAAAEFSGGWRMRVALAGVLFAAPDLLLLDEPTNYLDLEGAVWLETFLARYPNTALIISHDRGLLNRAVAGVLHLADAKLTLYAGGYDQFEATRRAEAERRTAQKKRQDAERARIQGFVDRFRAKATKARQAQARLKMLEKMTPIAAVVSERVAPFAFPDPTPLSPPLLSLEEAAVGYGGPPVLSGLSLRIDPDDRIALLGANGQGKSTFAKLIAGKLAPVEGRVVKSAKMKVGYFAQHQLDELTEGETPVRHLARWLPEAPEAALRARLAAVGVDATIAESPVEKLSGGQKARLLLALATVEAPHLVLLDEPTNHLDVESREALAQALAAYQGAVVLISHDPHLVASVADRLWRVGDGRVSPYDGDIDTYRAELLSARSAARRDGGEGVGEGAGDARREQRRRAAELRKKLAPLKAEAAAAESRVEKLEEMRGVIEARLADPALYEGDGDRIATLQKKLGEITAGLARAEGIWERALERLEALETELAAVE